MIKKQWALALAILLYSSVAACASTVYLHSSHSIDSGKFESPDGVFTSELNINPGGEFTTQGMFSTDTILENTDSGEFKSSTGVFNQSSNEFSDSGSIFKAPEGEFSSDGLISGADGSTNIKDSFRTPNQGDFIFSLSK